MNEPPKCAFHELRQEYSNGGCYGDPMAEFYERTQGPNEEIGSFAIGLEGILCTIEKRDYGGFPVEERDAKLTHQFMRGLRDEEVWNRLAPVRPRLMTFRCLKDERRHISREWAMRSQGCRGPKLQHQQVRAESAGSTKPDPAMKEVSTLLHGIKENQDKQTNKMAVLERRIDALEIRAQPPMQPPPMTQQLPTARPFSCWTCGQEGHISRSCPTQMAQSQGYFIAHSPVCCGQHYDR